MRALLPVTVLALALAAPAVAQMAPMTPMAPAPACPAAPAPLPPELAGWSAMAPVKAATASGELALATLTIGQGAKATLSPTAAITYPLAPGHAGASATFGGLLAFTVTEAGSYRVALGGGPWIDVVKDGAAVTSRGHGHGPACTSVRKTVDFTLQPGRYTLQVSGATSAELALMVARLPA